MFQLKKIVGALLLPIPLILLLIAAGLVLLLLNRYRPVGIATIVAGWLLLFVTSLAPFSQILLKPLEACYPTWHGQNAPNYIVVLGNGYTWQPNWAPSSNLSSTSLFRVNEAIRQWRRFPASTLIFTGANGRGNPKSNAWVAGRVAESLGVPSEQIKIIETPKDTQQEAMAVKALIGSARFLLVSSASHLPRAMTIFHAAGLQPIPVPANQLADFGPLNLEQQYIPQANWLLRTEQAWYEYLGQVWWWLRAVVLHNDRQISQDC